MTDLEVTDRPVKIVCLFQRRPGMSMADFRDYYENRHVPLIRSLMPPMHDYRRNYASVEGTKPSPHAAPGRSSEPAFDVMTEITWADRAAFEANQAALADPVIGATIAADEEKFLDRPRMRAFFVDEAR